MEKNRATRNEGKRTWLYNGKAVIALFELSNILAVNKITINSIIGGKQHDQHG